MKTKNYPFLYPGNNTVGRKLLLLFLLLVSVSALKAQVTVSVSGDVSGNNTPVSTGEVFVRYYDDTLRGVLIEDTVLADSNGTYTSSKVMPANITQGTVMVSTTCGGKTIVNAAVFYPGNYVITNLDLHCLPSTHCTAYFVAQSFSQANVVVFSATLSGTPMTDYIWDFGDGTTGSGPYITHTYANGGVYYACLTVNDTLKTCSATYCDSVRTTFDSTNTFCNASFDYKFDGSGSVSFAALNSNPMSGAYYQWDFGDGTTGWGGLTSHQYSQPGYYLACLSVIDSFKQCYDVQCQMIRVEANPQPCDASFSVFLFPDSMGLDNTVYFAGMNTNTPFLVYYWDFGDGTTSNTGPYIQHTYANEGTYTVCLVVTDTLEGCTDTVCQSIQIADGSLQIVLGIEGADKKVSIKKLYPNPAEDIISLDLSVLNGDKGTLIIRDLMGREMYKEKRTLNAGNNEWQINVADWSSGIYFIEVQSSSAVAGTKFIKK